ncbi:MAG: TolC family protein [Stellaceae bacterium]
MLAGCAGYHPLPLARTADLKRNLASLDTIVPAGPGDPAQPIAIDKPLTINAIGLLAILNDPALKSEPGEKAVARSGLVQASLLPNPSAGLSYAALLGGPGTAPAYAASLSQDIASIITYRARVNAAKAHVAEVNADLLWREWQVAQKARLLGLDIAEEDRSIALATHERDLIAGEVAAVRKATAAGNLALPALAPLLAAEASAEKTLATLTLDREQNWQGLDGLLRLLPDARFAIAPPSLPAPPPNVARLIASLPARRPDLVALRLGYRVADENVRAAILGQFPAFVLGGSWGSDTTGVVSAGPTVTFDLPIFDRNQGHVAATRATRLLLKEQYQSRLDQAVVAVRGLIAQARGLAVDLARARRAADAARTLAKTARSAYAQGNLDQRSLTDYETAALERELTAVGIGRSLGEAEIAATIELGLGLPQTTIAAQGRSP